MSTRALTRMSGLCMLIGSILAFAGERMSYDYAQPTQNAFQSVFYVPGKTLVFVGVVLVLMGLPSLWGYLCMSLCIDTSCRWLPLFSSFPPNFTS